MKLENNLIQKNSQFFFFFLIKKSCPHIDKDNYIEGKKVNLKLIRRKKKACKLSKNIAKDMELWKNLKFLDQKCQNSNNCIEIS